MNVAAGIPVEFTPTSDVTGWFVRATRMPTTGTPTPQPCTRPQKVCSSLFLRAMCAMAVASASARADSKSKT